MVFLEDFSSFIRKFRAFFPQFKNHSEKFFWSHVPKMGSYGSKRLSTNIRCAVVCWSLHICCYQNGRTDREMKMLFIAKKQRKLNNSASLWSIFWCKSDDPSPHLGFHDHDLGCQLDKTLRFVCSLVWIEYVITRGCLTIMNLRLGSDGIDVVTSGEC